MNGRKNPSDLWSYITTHVPGIVDPPHYPQNGEYNFLVYGTKDIGGGLIFLMHGKWGEINWCMEKGGGDMKLKYTFECGARPAGSASCKYSFYCFKHALIRNINSKR